MARKTIKIDPEHHFKNWAFDIKKALWPALGVTLREFIDQDKTRAAREQAEAQGAPPDKIKKIRITKLRYARHQIPVYDFCEGDIYYLKDSQERVGLQVAVIRDQIEVHCFDNNQYTFAVRVTPNQLASWLETGSEPPECRIDRFQSWRELAKYYLGH